MALFGCLTPDLERAADGDAHVSPEFGEDPTRGNGASKSQGFCNRAVSDGRPQLWRAKRTRLFFNDPQAKFLPRRRQQHPLTRVARFILGKSLMISTSYIASTESAVNEDGGTKIVNEDGRTNTYQGLIYWSILLTTVAKQMPL